MNQATDNPLRGIALMLGFVLFGPFIDIFAKLATEFVPVFEIATGRFIVQTAILLPIAALMGLLALPTRRDAILYLTRGGLILLSTITIVGAVKFMPVADAVAIVFVEPLLLLLMGHFFLGESVGWRRMLACILGFVGALLVIQPSFTAFGWPAFLPLGTAVFFALYLLITRTMSTRLHPLSLQVWTGIGALLLSLPILVYFNGTGHPEFDPIWPTGEARFYVLGVGIAAVISHMFLSYAFRFAPTTLLASIHYLEIVTVSIFGYFVFGDLFNGLAAIGAFLIIAAGLYLIYRERQLHRAGLQ